MRFAGIDIGSERHVVAIVDQSGAVVLKATAIVEDAKSGSISTPQVASIIRRPHPSNRRRRPQMSPDIRTASPPSR
jgi:hypothetical protein